MFMKKLHFLFSLHLSSFIVKHTLSRWDIPTAEEGVLRPPKLAYSVFWIL